MNSKTICSMALALTCGAACSPAPESNPDQSAAPARSDETQSNAIEIPASVRRNLGISFATVELRHVEQTIRVPGAFELRPLARREYRMALAGRVELAVDQYEPVAAGELLFRFQSPTWPELLHEIIAGEQAIETARAEIEIGRARIVETKRTIELTRGRIRALAEADFKAATLNAEADALEASLPRFDAEVRLSQTRLANANRTREHALHRAATAAGLSETELEEFVTHRGHEVPRYLTIDWIEVRAVDPGIVEELFVTDGAFVEPPEPVISIVDPKRVRFRALALQADLPQLSGAVSAKIVPPQSPDIPISDAIPATMTFGLEAHPRERTLTLLATPESGAPWIRPGVSAFLEIVVDTTQAPELAVPRSAIIRDGLMHVFFRRDPANANRAIRVEADLGVSDGRWVVLKSGVMRGDEVVLAGVYELKLAMDQRGAAPQSGHVHADGSVHDAH